jgi:integrase
MKNPKMRKDGRYRKTVSLRKQTGSKKPKPIYGRTQEELDAKYIDFKYKMLHGDITDPQNLTVFGYLKTWFSTHKKKISPLTMTGYENYIYKHIGKDDFGSILLKDLKPMHIEAYYANELEKDRGKDKKGKKIIGYSGKTVLQEHRILHKAFKQAVRNELISKNPCDYVDAPRAEEFQVKIYNEDKFNLLLDAIENTPDELPILLAGMCGLRRSEVFGLSWSDIDVEEGKISVNKVAIYNKDKKEWILKEKPKNQTSRRTFTLPSEITPTFKKHKGIGLVCHDGKGGIVNGGTFSHHFSDLLDKHKLPHIRFHDLRHFNATMMLKYNVSDKEAARRLGHATPNTLRKTYQHHIDEMDKVQADKLNSVIRKKSVEGQAKGQA